MTETKHDDQKKDKACPQACPLTVAPSKATPKRRAAALERLKAYAHLHLAIANDDVESIRAQLREGTVSGLVAADTSLVVDESWLVSKMADVAAVADLFVEIPRTSYCWKTGLEMKAACTAVQRAIECGRLNTLRFLIEEHGCPFFVSETQLLAGTRTRDEHGVGICDADSTCLHHAIHAFRSPALTVRTLQVKRPAVSFKERVAILNYILRKLRSATFNTTFFYPTIVSSTVTDSSEAKRSLLQYTVGRYISGANLEVLKILCSEKNARFIAPSSPTETLVLFLSGVAHGTDDNSNRIGTNDNDVNLCRILLRHGASPEPLFSLKKLWAQPLEMVKLAFEHGMDPLVLLQRAMLDQGVFFPNISAFVDNGIDFSTADPEGVNLCTPGGSDDGDCAKKVLCTTNQAPADPSQRPPHTPYSLEPNSYENVQFPMMHRLVNGGWGLSEKIAMKMIEGGMDPNVLDGKGQTVLCRFIDQFDQLTRIRLIRSDVRPFLRDVDGKTFFHLFALYSPPGLTESLTSGELRAAFRLSGDIEFEQLLKKIFSARDIRGATVIHSLFSRERSRRDGREDTRPIFQTLIPLIIDVCGEEAINAPDACGLTPLHMLAMQAPTTNTNFGAPVGPPTAVVFIDTICSGAGDRTRSTLDWDEVSEDSSLSVREMISLSTQRLPNDIRWNSQLHVNARSTKHISFRLPSGDNALEYGALPVASPIIQHVTSRECFSRSIVKDGFAILPPGSTALHLAAAIGNAATAQHLSRHHLCDPNVVDDEGRTALHIAVLCGRLDVVTALVPASGSTTLGDLLCERRERQALESARANHVRNFELSTAAFFSDASGTDDRVYKKRRVEEGTLSLDRTDMTFSFYRGLTFDHTNTCDPSIRDTCGLTAAEIAESIQLHLESAPPSEGRNRALDACRRIAKTLQMV